MHVRYPRNVRYQVPWGDDLVKAVFVVYFFRGRYLNMVVSFSNSIKISGVDPGFLLTGNFERQREIRPTLTQKKIGENDQNCYIPSFFIFFPKKCNFYPHLRYLTLIRQSKPKNFGASRFLRARTRRKLGKKTGFSVPKPW